MIRFPSARLFRLSIWIILTFVAVSSAWGGVKTSGTTRSWPVQPSEVLAEADNSPRGPAIELRQGKAAPDGVLVKFKHASIGKVAMAAALVRENLEISREFASVPGLKRLVPVPSRVAPSFNKTTLLDTIQKLKNTGLFEYVEPDWQVHVRSTPTDAGLTSGDLWGLQNTGQDGGLAGIDVNVVPAWGMTSGSPSVVVGVIDTGIRYTHQDIASNMWTNPFELPGNGVDDDGNGYVDDVFGINAITGSGDPFDDNDHGTHVAGTIAASAFDSGQHVGVAYNVSLMALKFLNASGSGFTSDAIKCIEYAIAQGVDVLNNSWGGPAFSQALRDAIQSAHDAGILFVAAAGNSASNNDLIPDYPSSYDVPNLVAVAAIDRHGNLASFSSYGATSVDIAAPGVEILSTTATSDSSYASFNGTSMATPHVAGVAALLASQYPSAGVAELKNRLLLTAAPLPALSGRVASGGMVDANASLTVTADGELELSARSNGPLNAGQSNPIFIAVSDLLPVSDATVTGSFVGDATQAFFDNGLGADQAADDGIYSATLIAPTGASSVTLNVDVVAPGKNPAAGAFSFSIISPPANDDFADRSVLPLGTSQTTGTNRFASSEPGEPLNPISAGGKTVWWEWTAPASQSVTLSTTGSNFDTTLAVYRGNSLASLDLMDANDDASGLQSAVTFDAIAGLTYQLQIDGYAGSEGDIELNYPPPGSTVGAPVIVTQPSGKSVIVGDPFSLSVTAGGQQPLTYRWFLDGAPISKANGSEYSLAAAAETDEGSYTVEISNAVGSVVSNAAYVSVDLVGLVPDNDRFADAQTLPGSSGQLSGSNVRAVGEAQEPNHALVSDPLASVWYAWTAPTTGTLQINTLGSDFDTTLAIYRGSGVGSLTELASNDDSEGLQSAVTIEVVAGEPYRVAVDGYRSSEGAIRITVSFDPDDFPDHDSDGMIDDWELANGLNPNDPTDALKDADKDGFTNLDEFLGGSDPQDASSRPVRAVPWLPAVLDLILE